MKKIVLFVAVLLFYSTSSLANTSYNCAPTSGVPGRQSFIVSKTLTKEDNVALATIVPRTNIDSGGGSTSFTCNCPYPTRTASHYWSAQALFPTSVTSGTTWMQLTPNLAARVEIYIFNSTGGKTSSTYHDVPFNNITNNVDDDVCGTTGVAASGTKGAVTVKITKPAIGNISFNGLVAKIWHYRSSTKLYDPSDPPEAVVSLNLDITIPGGCTLLAGSVLNINLGQQTRQSQFVGKAYPEAPNSYVPRPVDLKFDCDFANSDMDVVLTGDADDQGQGYATSSPDVSVIVTDSNGVIIPPNAMAGSVTVDSSSTSSTLNLKAYPTNSGSQASPEATDYNATATILLSYQ